MRFAVGAEVQHNLADAFWGKRHGQLRYPFGNLWNPAQRIRDVSPEEMAQAAAAIFPS
jgi:PhnB protein